MKLNGNPEKDIFKSNPDLQYMEVGKLAILRFGKTKASKILWALYLMLFPDNRVMFQMKLKERQTTINANYLNEDITWEDHSDLIALFKKEVMSRERRALLSYTEVFDEITEGLVATDKESPSQRKNAAALLLKFPELRKSLQEQTLLFEQDLELEEEEVDVTKIHGNASISRRESRHS